MSRCRIFICETCRRIIAGCLEHHAVVEPIASCAFCAQDQKSNKSGSKKKQ